jgi:NADH:ubiquinone oxidoreductase subunit 6 (subunit J)
MFAFVWLYDLFLPVAVPCVVAAAGVYLLLPRPQGSRNALLGALLGGLALLIGAIWILHTGVLSPETVLFYAFSALAVAAGVLLVTQRNPARAALSFALVVLSTCGLFLLLAAPFLMAATIIIYAGAIIVTFLFVLMLASQAGATDADARTREPLLATILGFLLMGCLIYVLQVSYETNETVRELDKMLADTRQARARVNVDHREDYVKWREHLEEHFDRAIDQGRKNRPEGQTKEMERLLRETIHDAFMRSEWSARDPQKASVDELRTGLQSLEQALLRIRQQHGWLQPIYDRAHASAGAGVGGGAASDLSGPPAIESAKEWRYDADARPHMPADNSAFLGRSLFTDFLLPVELGGILLLVAAIGAIAITHRHTAPARAS